jgi:hypothetical protein
MFGRAVVTVTSVRRRLLSAALQSATLLIVVSVASGGSSERDDLDQIWNEHMLAGKAALIILDKGSESTTEAGSIPELSQGRLPAVIAAHSGITVHRVGKGIWTNGGWILQGGLLGRVEIDSVAYEFFGKEVIRRIPYFPFPFHRDPPQESGYEFFLVRRGQRDIRGSVVRQWAVSPTDVRLSESGSTDVSAAMTRAPGGQTVVITVYGLKLPFVQRVDLSVH